MTDNPSVAPLTWVYKRDGRLVAFAADKISRSLFAASEQLGQPDAFLARELTDGILHFLSSETEGAIPTTAQIAEQVIKVVRELGHPGLSQAFADSWAKHRQAEGRRFVTEEVSGEQPAAPVQKKSNRAELARWVEAAPPPAHLAWQLSRALLRDYSLDEIFTRDLRAAHADGLLVLGNLGTPLELAGAVLGRSGIHSEMSGPHLSQVIQEARGFAGEWLAVDCPEYALAACSAPQSSAADYARDMRLGLAATGLRLVVNLNCAQPPVWAGELAEGPLFAGHPRIPEPPGELADAVLDHFLQAASGEQGLPVRGMVRVDWHLGERDFQSTGAARLLRVARRAAEGGELAFVFDRPQQPPPLAEGMDRQHPAALMTVGLNLARLAGQPKVGKDPDLFVQKLGSLVRLALSAACQKRDFLRRHRLGRPGVTRGFLLNRARLLLAPIGLDEAIRVLLGRGLDSAPGLELAQRMVRELRQILRHDGAAAHLDTCLDAPANFTLDEEPLTFARPASLVAGLTPWTSETPAKDQLRLAGVLHAKESGTAAVLLAQDHPIAAEQAADLLRFAWLQTEIVRLRFVRLAQPQRQLMAPWEAAVSDH